MTTLTGTQEEKITVMDSAMVRFALGIMLSVVAGLMLLLAFPPYGIWPLAWIALVPYLFAQHRLLPRKWSSLGPAIATLLWLGPFLGRLFGSGFGPFFQYLGVWIALLIFFLSKERSFHEMTGYRWFIAEGVVAWVGFEMIRATFIPLIATSAFIGYTQATQPWLIQPISIFSVYGLNLMIVLVNFALAQRLMAWFDGQWQPTDVTQVNGRSTHRWLMVVAETLVVWVGISLVILNSAPADPPTVRVATLQPNYPKPSFQDDVATSEIRFETIVAQARQAAQAGAQIIFTPEAVFNFDPQVEFKNEFQALAAETGAYIFISYAVENGRDPFRNEAVLLTPAGEFLDVYAKNHAPPGEPLSPTAGVYPIYDTPLGKLATLICHDANYTDVARKLTRNGAQLIAAPYSEFGGFGEQLWTNVLFRAVENRTTMVLTGVATVSGIIDPYGRLIALDVNPTGEQLTLVEDVSLGSGNTPFLYLGDWLGWLSLGAYVLMILFQIVTERRAKKADSTEAQFA